MLELPGVMCYGVSRNDAAAKVKALALRAIADRLDEGEMAAPHHYRDDGNCFSMSQWPSLGAPLVLSVLLRIGWRVKRRLSGSGLNSTRLSWTDVEFAFHDGEEVDSKMLARLAKQSGLSEGDLQ